MDSAATPATPAPVAESQRLGAIDMLRGFAVLGILLMNIIGFGIYAGGDFFGEILQDPRSADFATLAVVLVLWEGKMRALFCMLFGAGILLFTRQKEATGVNVTKLFYIRMVWLVVFGLVNAHLLLWSGDILYFYGLFGMLVYLLRRLPPRWMAAGVPIVAIIGFVLSTVFVQGIRTQRLAYVDAQAAVDSGRTLTPEQQQALDGWREVEKNFFPNPEDQAKSVAAMRGSYAEVAAEVRKDAFEYQTKYLLLQLGDNVALMLLGMALLHWGFFAGQWSDRAYQRTMLIGYGIGLPLVIFSFWFQATTVPTQAAFLLWLETHPINWMGLIYPAQRILLVMAHCALLLMMLRHGWLAKLFDRLRAVGQMALTNYLAQSVLCTLFFFGYGLGYYDTLAFHQLYYVVLGVWILELLWSPWWLKRFRFGPAEWLWRTLMYRRMQPMRR
jgi:uncharacterized protein